MVGATGQMGRKDLMDRAAAEPEITFSQPIRQIVTMLLACGLVGAGAWLIHSTVIGIIATNPMLNGETIRLDGALRMAPR